MAPLRVVQWNIERGYQLQKIREQLLALDADLISVQEVDVHCERSGWVDVGVELAQSLHMNYAFVCEFEELHSPLRSAHDQGGGVHGNAILSRYDFKEIRGVKHSCQPVDWYRDGAEYREPRRGHRYWLSVVLSCPTCEILCYCVHFEVFCGIKARVCQLADVFADARQLEVKYPRQLLVGDLNTMGHTLARLSPKYCVDKMRWLSLWRTEPWWLYDNVLRVTREQGDVNPNLVRLGFPEHCCRDAINPGFIECFDLDDITLINYWGFYKAKLDWVLVRQMGTVVEKRMGNEDYSASDHKWLCVGFAVV
eukprot:TRINITY_DN2549_c0_g1_i1.p1 TRINITY_DN2549_c0_g1~~TRINITY_DN2549_c0_g1_i1.p1  ORF type:complete len:357 (-),score=124.30 TRINITY_DN2549_c0_g1_i1:32-958(-)